MVPPALFLCLVKLDQCRDSFIEWHFYVYSNSTFILGLCYSSFRKSAQLRDAIVCFLTQSRRKRTCCFTGFSTLHHPTNAPRGVAIKNTKIARSSLRMQLIISLSHEQEAGGRRQDIQRFYQIQRPFLFLQCNATRLASWIGGTPITFDFPSHSMFLFFLLVDMVPMGHNGDDCCLGESEDRKSVV